jgi:hypothetical protein
MNFKYRIFISLIPQHIKDGSLAPQQLEEAIQEQSIYPLKLGEILIQKGWLAPQALQEALQEQNWRKKGFWII